MADMWQEYEPLLKALVELFHPFVEIAIHDLEKGEIVALFHNISQRKIGDPSPLKELGIPVEDFPPYFSPYYKRNFDGRSLKCSSITIRKNGKAVALICINVDVSAFQEGHRLIETFLSTKQDAKHPIDMHGGNLEEKTSRIIEEYLQGKHWVLKYLNRQQKKELVQTLFKRGVFNFKNAVPFVAKYLNMSRASVYNYIRFE